MSSPQDFSKPQVIQAGEAEAGRRLDNYLAALLHGVPRSRLYRILRKGEVRVNKGRVTAQYRIQPGDLIRIPPIRVAERPAISFSPKGVLLQLLEQRILFEDERLLVINKPSGLAVHGGSGLNYGLIEAMRHLRPHDRHLELVHRLDRDTSGCLMLSRKPSALRLLHERIRANAVGKTYLALLAGQMTSQRVSVDAPLMKNVVQSGERFVRVDPNGKPSLSHFTLVERLPGCTLVRVKLETGRTHQIRVHAAHLGLPILGDEKYGDEAANRHFRALGLKRLFLHAAELTFRWPGEKALQRFQAPLDESLQTLLQKIKT